MALEQLQQEPMMAHLIATLDAGNSVGHYGRLVFAIVGRFFLDRDELCRYLARDPECDSEQAATLVEQVESRDYNPPKRERILDWMRQQEFPVCPDPKDTGVCNVYRNLKFPQEVYEKINEFHRENN